MLRSFAEQLLVYAGTKWGPVVMVLHSFLESFVLPVTHEVFLIPVCLAKPHLSLLFALASSVASTAGISVGYFLGHVGGRPMLAKFVKPELLILVKKEIHKHDVWAIAFACLTPIPVKIFALAAGAFQMPFRRLIIIAFLSRSLRFSSIAVLLYFYGDSVREWLLNYLDVIMIGLIVSAIIFTIALRMMEKRLAKTA